MLLRVVTYNIRYGGRGHEAHILRVLHAAAPDVILLQEVTQSELIIDFATSLKYHYFIAQGHRFSLALISRFPIVEAHTHSQFPLRDCVLEAAIEYVTCQRCYVVGVHPIAFPGTFFEYWRDWELSIGLKCALSHHDYPCFMAGDFNAISPHDYVATNSAPRIMQVLYGLQMGYIYRHAMRKILATGLVDCYRWLHPTDDGFTIPAPVPKVRLDYILANQQLSPYLTRCDVVTEPAEAHLASDHYPLIADFEVQ